MLTPGSFIAPGAIANYSAKSALFTISAADRSTFFDNTGTYSITLPAASTVGAGFNWYSRNTSGTQTFAPAGANLINSATTYVSSNAGDVITGISTGTNWVIEHTQRPSTVAITGGTISVSTVDTTGIATLQTVVGTSTQGPSLYTPNGGPGSPTIGFNAYRNGTSNYVAGVTGTQGLYQYDNTSGTLSYYTDTATNAGSTMTPVLKWDITVGGDMRLYSTTVSSSTSTGSLILNGGLGVAGKGYFGDDVTLSAAKIITAPGGLIIGNETMSVYDEGSFTPTIAGDGTAGSNTYTVQTGRYVKIGKFVIANFCITMSVKDAAMAGNITLAGLPFAAANAANNSGSSYVSIVDNVAFGSFLGLNIAVNSTFAYLVKNTTAGAIALVQPVDLTVTVQIRGTCSYITT